MSDIKNHTQVIDKLIRNRIFNSRYWKQQCFALNAQTLIDKAIKIKYIGSLYGGVKKPTKFLCLLYKMLQMNLNIQITKQYLKARQYKYLTILTLLYLRLIIKGQEIFYLLQPFYNDNRKLIIRNNIGKYQIIYIDQLIDQLLRNQIVLNLNLPFLAKRITFQEKGLIQPRVSILQQEVQKQMQQINQQEEEEEEKLKINH